MLSHRVWAASHSVKIGSVPCAALSRSASSHTERQPDLQYQAIRVGRSSKTKITINNESSIVRLSGPTESASSRMIGGLGLSEDRILMVWQVLLTVRAVLSMSTL